MFLFCSTDNLAMAARKCTKRKSNKDRNLDVIYVKRIKPPIPIINLEDETKVLGKRSKANECSPTKKRKRSLSSQLVNPVVYVSSSDESETVVSGKTYFQIKCKSHFSLSSV